MKKIIFSLALAFLGFSNLFAAKAKPGIITQTLADGTIVQATLHGDENFHYYTLLDGTPLKMNADGKYEISTTEELQARHKMIQQKLEMARQKQEKAYMATRATSIGKGYPSYFPHIGSPKALVILVQFQDVKFKSSDPVATFTHYFNGKIGEEEPEATQAAYITDEDHHYYGGVKQYFSDMSNQKFTPQFDIVGSVTVSQKSAYYGTNNSGDGDDANYTQMISEACQSVDDQVNFADYDSDGDGYVDLVYVIYAGYSESYSGNSEDCLWPKSGTNNFVQVDANGKVSDKTLQLDGKYFCRFGISNELNETPKNTQPGEYYLDGIGLFCHEFSHTMGMPDLYVTDTNSSAAKLNNQTPEYWSVMDMGEYSDNGYCPSPYSAWESYMMGWTEPTTLPAQAQQIKLEPFGTSRKSYKIDADDEAGEYLLLQSIQNEGWWKSLPGYGLLVWRIDYADKATIQLNDNPNNTAGKPSVMVVPADGLVINSANIGSAGITSADYLTSLENDPFPSYKEGTAEIDVNSLTTIQLNHSILTNRPLYNIMKDEATGYVTFDYLKDYTTGIKNPVNNDKAGKTPTEYFDLEGRKIKTPQKGHLYVTNKNKKVIYN